jgi:2-isopropylmalate synthase
VLVETMDNHAETTWMTVGVGPNVVEASWEALVDAITFGLLRAGVAAGS